MSVYREIDDVGRFDIVSRSTGGPKIESRVPSIRHVGMVSHLWVVCRAGGVISLVRHHSINRGLFTGDIRRRLPAGAR
jgi:hypothetical protein